MANNLPYDCELEYLESTGTQYIDTGISMASNSAVPLKVSVDSYGVVNHGIIHNNVAAGTWLGVAHPIDLADFRIYKNNYNTKVVRSYSDARYIHVWDGSSGFYENGVLVESFTAGVGTDDITGIPWYLGRSYDFYTSSSQTSDTKVYKIYSAQMWVSGVLVRNFQPVMKAGVGYLYDKVSGTLFGNAGTGSFVLGPRVTPLYPIPANATRIRYLESTGTQYVDTLTPMDGNLRVVLDYVCLNTLVRPFGAADVRGTTKNQWYLVNDRNQAVSNCSLGSTTNANINIGQSPVGVRATATIDGRTLSAYGGTATVSSWTLTPKTDDCTLGLFSCHVIRTDGSNPWVLHASMQLYSCAIYDGSTLVRDFVPVRAGQTGYLFDRVSGQLFGNAGTGDFVLGPDTFAQGVIPTRMMVVGVRKKPKPPTVFNYIGVKRFAHRRLRAYTSLSSWQSSRGGQYDQQSMQISRVDFIKRDNSNFSYPSGMMFRTFTMFNGRKMLTKPVAMSNYASGENLGRIFDHSTSTKWCSSFQSGGGSLTDVYDLSDTTYSAAEADRPYAYNLRSTYNAAYYNSTFGCSGRLNPCAIVLDLTSSPLDISLYDRWVWYTANDTAGTPAGAGQRQWIEGEIVGSVDGITWWRLDIFNDIDMPTTNYGLAYTGDLIPRLGDIWSDLDFSTRDWANGVAVDSI